MMESKNVTAFRTKFFKRIADVAMQDEKIGKDTTMAKKLIKTNIVVFKEMPEYGTDAEFKAFVDSAETV